MRELTTQERGQVAGGNPAGAALGAAINGAAYLGHASVSGDFSWGGFGLSMVSGGIGGMFGPIRAVQAYVAPRTAFVGGGAVAAVEDS